MNVTEYNTTAVGSVIYYQCHEQGFVGSLCGEDGMWNPDPSQLMCGMEPTVMTGRPVEVCLLQYDYVGHIAVEIIPHLKIGLKCQFCGYV